MFGLHRRIGPAALEIGYWLHPDYPGRGYATKAVSALTEAALSLHHINRVEIHTTRPTPPVLPFLADSGIGSTEWSARRRRHSGRPDGSTSGSGREPRLCVVARGSGQGHWRRDPDRWAGLADP